MNINRQFALSLIVGVLLIGFASAQTQEPNVRFPAPSKREQQATKSLSGQVVDAQKTGVPQAVVHVKNKKTADVRTRIAGPEGRFVIRGLDRDTDYEVHAEFQGSSSDTKAISSFDDRDEIQVTLELKSGR